jgi:putative oxidoreductase
MKVGRLLLRTTIGGFFIGHGAQKLFGAFGGGGLQATAEAFESMGLRPGIAQATAAGVAEAGGGAGLLLGYQTPLAASALVATMLTAINRVHLKAGPWVTKGGYEYNVVLIAGAVALADAGPGKLSLDALRGKERSGTKWGLAALALGAAGAAGAHIATETFAPPVAPEPLPTEVVPPPSPAAAAPTPAADPVSEPDAPAVDSAVSEPDAPADAS